MKLIIGLGNPGDKYVHTRHNLGFMVVDELAKRGKPFDQDQGKLGESWKYEKKFKSEVCNFTLNALPLTLVKPQTYMNNSGLAVQMVVDYFKVDLEDVIVVYDELDLPLGKIKVRLGGAAAGHHGVESIINTLKDDKFIRIRLGIGNQKTHLSESGGEHINVDHFVTEEFKSGEKSQVKHMLSRAEQALDILIKQGLSEAQNQFN